MKYQALRLLLWRWHRRLGLAAAVFLIWLAVSGVMLNHTSSLGLASTPLPSRLAGAVYPLVQSPVYRVQTSVGLLTHRNQSLFKDTTLIAHCEGLLVGVIELENDIWLACPQQLLLLDKLGNLIEVMDQYFALPVPIERVGTCAKTICLASGAVVYQFYQGHWQQTTVPVAWNDSLEPTETVAQIEPEIHHWERFILEAHSGRLFGRYGVLIVDLAALATILLALSGCYVYWSHNRRRRLAKRQAAQRNTVPEHAE